MTGEKLIVENRRARHDYHILERIEAGIALTGTEVKSLRDGGGNLREAYAVLRGGEAYLVGANIAPYRQGNIQNHEPTRDRKLLLHRREIDKLQVQTRDKGLSLIPTKIYLKDGRIKCELAVAKGKKLHDKREAERARTAEAEARAEMRRRA
jgi:SsrA-binding protein